MRLNPGHHRRVCISEGGFPSNCDTLSGGACRQIAKPEDGALTQGELFFVHQVQQPPWGRHHDVRLLVEPLHLHHSHAVSVAAHTSVERPVTVSNCQGSRQNEIN
jgi:hypothetical protein